MWQDALTSRKPFQNQARFDDLNAVSIPGLEKFEHSQKEFLTRRQARNIQEF
jgi:hypothetical protein